MIDNHIAIGLRIHRQSVADRSLDYLRSRLIEPLQRAVSQLREYCPSDLKLHIMIAYDAGDSLLADQVCMHFSTPAVLVPIQPWGFSTALNGLLFQAMRRRIAEYILFLSTEIRFPSPPQPPNILSAMLKIISDDPTVLVVGHALPPDHQFQPAHETGTFNAIPLRGLNSPWNTISMWRLSRLANTGFQLISDYPEQGAIEEVAVIALHQRLYGHHNSKAILVHVGQDGVHWNTADWQDAERKRWHAFKMSSKDRRAEFQLSQLNLLSSNASDSFTPIIHHLNIN